MLARLFLAVQAVAFTGWWLALWASPELRAVFLPAGVPWVAQLAFLPADAIVVAMTPVVLAGLRRQAAAAALGAWFIAGLVTCSAVYCVALFALTGGAVAAAACMVPSAALSIWAAARLWSEVR